MKSTRYCTTSNRKIQAALVLLAAVIMIFAYTRFRVPAHTDESNPLIVEIIEDIHEN